MWILPQENRKKAKTPVGIVFAKKGNEEPQTQVIRFIRQHGYDTVLIVGDVATKTLVMEGLEPSIAIIDGKTKRGPYEQIKVPLTAEVTVINPAGEIRDSAIDKINKAIKSWLEDKQSTIIKVIGEEDLLTIPAVLAAPNRAVIIYGQPNVGLVLIEVNENTQQKFQDILRKSFKRIDDKKNG
jgi:uncharacterized protein (UPF0218 family)